MPWSLPAFYGLWCTRTPALRDGRSPERFLWCWALAPVLLLSLSRGKHHHYLLPCLAPWAILGALGAAELWQRARGWPWAARRSGRHVFAALTAATVLGYAAVEVVRAVGWDPHRDDMVLVQQVVRRVPAARPILVMDRNGSMTASWLLFYIGPRAWLLHNVTFLADERLRSAAGEGDVYLVARRSTERALGMFGSFEMLLESRRSQYERTPDDRYRLYRVRLHDTLPRLAAPRVSPLQAFGAPGPFMIPVPAGPAAEVFR